MLSQTSGATVECTGRDVKDRIKKTRRRVAFCLSGHCVEHQAKTIIQQRESCGSVTVGDNDSLVKTIIQQRESCGSVTVGDIDSLVKYITFAMESGGPTTLSTQA